MKNVFSRISSSPVVRCCHWSYTWRSKQRMCGTAGSSGTLRARRSHQLCEGTCWAKQEAATWACSASRDLWPPDCSCWMQSTLLLTPHGDAGCLSHYMLLTYAQISAVTEYSGADDFWKKFKRLVFLYKALINQVVDIRFYRSPPVLPCFEGKPSEAKLHPNLSLSQDRPFYFHQLHSLSFCSCPFLTISRRLCVIQSHRSPSPQKQAFLDCACRHPRVSQTAICCSSKLDRQR